jgi:hypothetical protein
MHVMPPTDNKPRAATVPATVVENPMANREDIVRDGGAGARVERERPLAGVALFLHTSDG